MKPKGEHPQIIGRAGSSTVKENEDELTERTPKTYRRDRRSADPKQSSRLAERQGERLLNMQEVGGSNPSQRVNLLGTRTPEEKKIKRFQLRWKEPLGKKECPYAYR